LRKSRLLVRTTPPIAFLIFISFLQYTIHRHSPSIPHLVALAMLFFVPISLKVYRSYWIAAWIMPTAALTIIPIGVYMEGGLTSHAALWFVVIPIFSTFLLGTQRGLLVTAATGLELLMLFALHSYDQIPANYEPSSHWFFATTILSLIAFSSYLAWLYETGNQRFENGLKKSRQKAMDAVKEKNLLWTSISHELRTPLNGIIGFSNVLASGKLEREETEILGLVRDSAEALNILVSDILDYTRLEGHQLTLEKAPFDLEATVREVAELFHRSAKLKGVRVSWIMDQDVPRTILADGQKIHQILVNLTANAVKFTQTGHVKILVERTLGLCNIRFSVIDTGAGISKEQIQNIFTPFAHVHGGDLPQGRGPGLGLAICKGLVTLMGGEFSIESTPEVGSSFAFTIATVPIRSNAPAATGPVPLLKERRALSVLVAEDNTVNQKLLISLVSKLGHHVTTVSNGEEALTAVSQTDYDIVLMDIQMPVMDGITATRAIIEKLGEKSPPIVAVTANVLLEDRMACLDAGMVDFLTKPINLALLRKMLERLGVDYQDPGVLYQRDKQALSSSSSSEQAYDHNAMLVHFEADWGIIAPLIEQFESRHLDYLSRIETAIAAQDAQALVGHAHSLKGTISNFFATSLVAKLQRLESHGHSAELDQARLLSKEIEAEVKALAVELMSKMKHESNHAA
jgi:signal transduction histidine kinase/CheY-like chemotaxis protein/HPt (histidine-containing phosphotransfer) domain-containing protein